MRRHQGTRRSGAGAARAAVILAAAVIALGLGAGVAAAQSGPASEPAPETTPEPRPATEPEAETGAAPALSADPISALLAEQGLSATIEAIEAKASPSPEELFALAGARFLRAIERSAQERYRYNAGQVDYAPVLRLPLPSNPEPEPFDTEVVERVFEGVLEDMAGVEAALAAIPLEALETDAFGVTLSLDDLWIDANANGARDEAGPVTETVMDLSGGALGVNLRGMRGTLVRFDAADVAWLRAYAHLLSGVSQTVLALDPTAALEAARPGWEAAAEHRSAGGGFGMAEELWIDQAAATLMLLRGAPDAERSRAALAHFQAMIAQNRVFWSRVALEKDNLGEWIPNPAQKSALGGAQVTAEIAQGWIAVLEEIDKVLKGELLIPYWRYGTDKEGSPIGINLRRVFEEPRPIDLPLWVQGAAAAPYLEKGPLASSRAFMAFEQLATGRSLSYALWFN